MNDQSYKLIKKAKILYTTVFCLSSLGIVIADIDEAKATIVPSLRTGVKTTSSALSSSILRRDILKNSKQGYPLKASSSIEQGGNSGVQNTSLVNSALGARGSLNLSEGFTGSGLKESAKPQMSLTNQVKQQLSENKISVISNGSRRGNRTTSVNQLVSNYENIDKNAKQSAESSIFRKSKPSNVDTSRRKSDIVQQKRYVSEIKLQIQNGRIVKSLPTSRRDSIEGINSSQVKVKNSDLEQSNKKDLSSINSSNARMTISDEGKLKEKLEELSVVRNGVSGESSGGNSSSVLNKEVNLQNKNVVNSVDVSGNKGSRLKEKLGKLLENRSNMIDETNKRSSSSLKEDDDGYSVKSVRNLDYDLIEEDDEPRSLTSTLDGDLRDVSDKELEESFTAVADSSLELERVKSRGSSPTMELKEYSINHDLEYSQPYNNKNTANSKIVNGNLRAREIRDVRTATLEDGTIVVEALDKNGNVVRKTHKMVQLGAERVQYYNSHGKLDRVEYKQNGEVYMSSIKKDDGGWKTDKVSTVLNQPV